MKIVINNILPPKGFQALTIWPFIFVRKAQKDNVIFHETIHGRQQIEMLLIFFFLWYGIEWLVRWVCYGFDAHTAYHNVSFEQEAYQHEYDMDYKRKHFAWIKYISKKTYRK